MSIVPFNLQKNLIINPSGNLICIDARQPFTFKIDTTKGNEFNSFSLPLTKHTTNIYVKTSDGQRFTITNYLDIKRTINFASAGVYTIELRGQCGWSFNNTGDCQKLTEVIKGGNLLFNSLSYGFYGCINLRSIPYDWVINAPLLISAPQLFALCSNLSCAIPPQLLYGMPLLENAALLFFNCVKLYGSIPPLFFYKSQKLKNATSVFYNNTMLSGHIPDFMFAYSPLITTIASCFFNCKGLTGQIPPYLLQQMPLLTSVSRLFYGCTGLTGISILFFTFSPNLTNVSYVLYGCVNINVDTFFLPSLIIPNITTFENMMYSTELSKRFIGTIQEIWLTASPTSIKLNAFTAQTLLTNYASIPDEWKGL